MRCFSDMVDIVFPILEVRMLVREWLWKKSLLLQLSGEVFIVICSNQLLGEGERGGML